MALDGRVGPGLLKMHETAKITKKPKFSAMKNVLKKLKGFSARSMPLNLSKGST